MAGAVTIPSSLLGGVKFPIAKKTPPASAPPPAVDPLLAAQQIAAGLINPQIAAINRAAQQRQQELLGQQEAYKGVIGAVGHLTEGIPESIRAAYQNAGADVSGYAGDLTGQIGDAARRQAAEVAARLASFGTPGIAADTGGLDVANYLGGALPASSLAAEAASRLAEAQGLRQAQGGALAQNALQAMNASQQEVAALRAKGLDLELSRPAEVQKALVSLREENRANQELELKRQDLILQGKASGAQIESINRAWYQTLANEAWNRTNATGNLWVVKGNKLVDTGRKAPGSTALKAAADRAARLKGTQITQAGETARANASLAERQAHNQTMEGIANAQLGINQQRADAYAAKNARLAKGGFSSSQVAKWGDTVGRLAYSAFHGVPNPNYNPQATTDPGDKNYDPKVVTKYTVRPVEVGEFLRAMLARGIPYSIVYDAIRRYASAPNSWWAPALSWQKHWHGS